MRHNRLRDVTVAFCHNACLGVKMEVGSRLTPDLRQSRPADVLVVDWERGRPTAWDVTVTSSLTPAVLNEAGMTAGAAAAAAAACMATGAEKHTTLLPVWLLGLPSVFLCRRVRSLLIFLADLHVVWC